MWTAPHRCPRNELSSSFSLTVPVLSKAHDAQTLELFLTGKVYDALGSLEALPLYWAPITGYYLPHILLPRSHWPLVLKLSSCLSSCPPDPSTTAYYGSTCLTSALLTLVSAQDRWSLAVYGLGLMGQAILPLQSETYGITHHTGSSDDLGFILNPGLTYCETLSKLLNVCDKSVSSSIPWEWQVFYCITEG